MKNSIPAIIIAIVFIWAGMVIGISFLEAPLKFQAPGITLQLGLGIGKLVFGALTKAEMGFSLILISLLLLSQNAKSIKLFAIPIIIVAIDNVYLLPILDGRIDMITSGQTPPESSAHWWYVGLELVKLLSLLIGGYLFTHQLINLKKSNS